MHHEIIIVGGGIIGLTLANLLAKNNFKVALVAPDLDQTNKCQRYYAINPCNLELLSQINCWPLNDYGIFKKIKVWDSSSAIDLEFDSAKLNKNYLGVIVEDNLLKQRLINQLSNNNNCQIIHDSIQEISWNNTQIKLNNIIGQLAIAADGAKSWLRTMVDLPMQQKPYNQHAIITNITTTEPHQDIAYQRFLPNGPVALLPLSHPNCSSIVWTTSPAQASQLTAMSEPDFCHQLSIAADLHLGRIKSCSKPISFPLVMRQAERYYVQRVVLVGDSAHTVHPMMGQGLNLGLQDVASLVHYLLIAKNNKLDYFEPVLLDKYQAERKLAGMSLHASIYGTKLCFNKYNLAKFYGAVLHNNIIPKLLTPVLPRIFG